MTDSRIIHARHHIGREVDLILRNGKSVRGVLESVGVERLTLRSGRSNARLQLPVAAILTMVRVASCSPIDLPARLRASLGEQRFGDYLSTYILHCNDGHEEWTHLFPGMGIRNFLRRLTCDWTDRELDDLWRHVFRAAWSDQEREAEGESPPWYALKEVDSCAATS